MTSHRRVPVEPIPTGVGVLSHRVRDCIPIGCGIGIPQGAEVNAAFIRKEY
jgi:hypothetical protein